jgi:hypothetical protein
VGYVASSDPSDWDFTPPEVQPRSRAEDVGTILLSNEFTTVRVRKVLTRNGERLEIEAPKSGTVIQLDPIELESLTWQEPEVFSEFQANPPGAPGA